MHTLDAIGRRFDAPPSEVVDDDITGCYIDRDLMRGTLFVKVEYAGQIMKRRFNLKDFDDYATCLRAAQRWRDTFRPDRAPKEPPKRVYRESAAVEIARRDVAQARAKYGHEENEWWNGRSYIP